MIRIVFYGLFLAAVGVLPYLSSEWSKASRSASSDNNSVTADGVTANGAEAGTAPAPHSAAAPAGAHAAPHSASPPVVSLAEAIRFDVTAAWLFQRWPRVTAGLPEGELQGYRMPLVTGTREDDVAGSLTYYFNRQQVCQRITFQGAVGDPRKITAYIVDRFGLQRQTSDDPALQLYQTRWNGKPVSELKIKAVPVVKADQPFARYDVQLVLNTWPRK